MGSAVLHTPQAGVIGLPSTRILTFLYFKPIFPDKKCPLSWVRVWMNREIDFLSFLLGREMGTLHLLFRHLWGKRMNNHRGKSGWLPRLHSGVWLENEVWALPSRALCPHRLHGRPQKQSLKVVAPKTPIRTGFKHSLISPLSSAFELGAPKSLISPIYKTS
jgi:hypothetical protein